MANNSINRLPFNPKGPFVALKRLKNGGRIWEVGETLDPKHLAVDNRRLQLLYDGKFINMKGDTAQPDEPEKDEEPAELVAGDGEFIYDPELHSIEHVDSEYWISDEEAYIVRVRAPVGKKLDTATGRVLVTAEEILAWGEDED